jgi:hypothetical protein
VLPPARLAAAITSRLKDCQIADFQPSPGAPDSALTGRIRLNDTVERRARAPLTDQVALSHPHVYECSECDCAVGTRDACPLDTLVLNSSELERLTVLLWGEGDRASLSRRAQSLSVAVRTRRSCTLQYMRHDVEVCARACVRRAVRVRWGRASGTCFVRMGISGKTSKMSHPLIDWLLN